MTIRSFTSGYYNSGVVKSAGEADMAQRPMQSTLSSASYSFWPQMGAPLPRVANE